MTKNRLLIPALGMVVVLAQAALAADIKTPTIADSRLELTLVAAEPEIVTPIGIAIDKRGRLFVVESHTHFPQTNYPGPKFDRIKLFLDGDGDGKADKITVFAEGLHHTMNLAFGPDGRLYAVHRNGVVRLDDENGDGVSESRATILEMETPGNYPHDGLGGVAFGPDGWLYVGQGENLGERYTLKGSDGSSHSGKGEGGNVFRCRPDGSQLQLFAIGFWNPFGLAFYGREFLLAVDNDPDSRPPNRLLDVVMHGDYGYKFRFGRSGLHPFQAWNGELPGTLPMANGTGEGASALLPCEQTQLPLRYRGAALVTASWDHQIEVHRLKPSGASLRSDREVLVQGDDRFRPVGLAAAPDGSVFITDWVDVSYNVHRKGRIWRLTAKPGSGSKPVPSFAMTPNAARKRMHRLLEADSVGQLTELRAALADRDPFLRSAAVGVLAKPLFRGAMEQAVGDKSPSVRLGALLALRRGGVAGASQFAGGFLRDVDPQIRLMAVVWAGEERMLGLTNDLGAALSAGSVTPALLRAHAATVQILAKESWKPHGLASGPAKLGFFNLEETSDETPFVEILKSKPSREARQARLDAVRHLAQTTNEAGRNLLKQLVLDRRDDSELRTEAIVSLAGPTADPGVLLPLLNDPSAPVRIEAARALRSLAADSQTRTAVALRLAESARKDPALAGQLRFVMSLARGVKGEARPGSDSEWRAALAGAGDAASGRRVFFHPSVGCGRCHRVEDYGGRIGPDLSTIARGADREKLMQSILHPSRDIAPQFVGHTVETRDGQTFTGLLIGQSTEAGVTLFMADGKAVVIPGALMASQTQSKVSLMPEDLAGVLTLQDFRDLLAFLLSRR